ncbi:SPOR domain-containing protein [Bordetella genomosp. 13]|uniref:SPOR domain-containing protein n=1 Tax=Bordetella genomosp. 13 TaxID=463040 RepID=UPI0011A1F8C9|nr:SPOR domain-containing protein [Bordetella genomosp. 13]
MGLFTRKNSAADTGSSRPRPSVTSEAQAAELRARARRRLAGAVVLVLAAVIVLPMVLDSEPVPVADDIPIRIPDRDTPFQPQVSEPQAQSGLAGQPPASGAAPADAASGQSGQAQAPAVQPGTATAAGQQPPTPPVPGQLADNTVPVTTHPATPPKPAETKPAETRPVQNKPVEAKPETPAKPPTNSTRTDDGARALALLEGRPAPAQQPAPAAKPAQQSGNFVLQIASYGAQADAQSRRTQLHQAGITNAFVEQASINGKQQYRLRVGPFPSREAAQAAQARLRTLGYDNGFIAAQ